MNNAELLKTIFFFTFFLAFNKICVNYNFFSNNISISKHKSFIKKSHKVLIIGGFFLLFGNIIFQKDFFLDYKNLFYSCLFCIGLFADIYKKFYPSIRLLLQVLIILFFVKIFNVTIKDVRIDFLNSILSKEFISIIFTVFCITILINGSNFIDGVNLSTISYYLLVFVTIFFLSENNNLFVDKYFLKIQIFLLLILLILNFINYLYLGDSGVYFISFITSFVIINFINNNSSISPYFAVLLLWYPCFENLFSIIRRISSSKKTHQADNYHLHHLMYLFFLKKNVLYPSNCTGVFVLFFNLIIFLLGSRFYDKTVYLLFLIFISTSIYCCCYFYLRKLLKR
jgi:UDP-N-acetylmuramyl pentapeptide phosphotransferase/UDP-N-acetylglucosamine-1-phosphate transferase